VAKTNKREKRERNQTNPWTYCLVLGIYAGLLWGVVRWLMHLVNFTSVVPGFLVEPFFRRSFLETYWGVLIGIGSFIVFSIIAAYVYKGLLGRFSGPWAGVIYGVLWWGVLFAAVGPMIGLMSPIPRLGWNTVIAELCFFAVWGLFIGYTIAFEFNEVTAREPMDAKLGSSGNPS